MTDFYALLRLSDVKAYICLGVLSEDLNFLVSVKYVVQGE